MKRKKKQKWNVIFSFQFVCWYSNKNVRLDFLQVYITFPQSTHTTSIINVEYWYYIYYIYTQRLRLCVYDYVTMFKYKHTARIYGVIPQVISLNVITFLCDVVFPFRFRKCESIMRWINYNSSNLLMMMVTLMAFD